MRLDKITKEQINKIKSYYKDYTIILWSSSLIGRKSKYGDIDVYLIGEKKPIKLMRESNLILDIEYLSKVELSDLLVKLNNRTSFMNLSEIKILFKLNTGKCIHLPVDYVENILKSVDKELIQQTLVYYWNSIYISLQEDIVKLNYSNYFYETIFQIFSLIECAEAIFLCRKGVPCIKRKWIHTDFLNNSSTTIYNEKFQRLITDLNNSKYEDFVKNSIKYANEIRLGP